MASKKEMWHPSFKGRALILAGKILLLIGILRFFKVDWNIVLMAIGLFLLLKGIWIRAKYR